jgi:hypothetical protein
MTQPARLAIITDLYGWEIDEGKTLPVYAGQFANIEEAGNVVDLETGDVRRTEPAVLELDPQAWLADLEAAGAVTVQWTCRPEDWDFERNCPKGQA